MSVMVAGLFCDNENEADRAQAVKRAMAMDSVSYNLGRALAPAVSILIFTIVGFELAFALNAGSFFLFTLVLVCLRPRARQQASNRSRVMNGLHIAVKEPRVIVLLLMVAVITVAADPILVLGPALTGHIFHSSADWSGVFIAALGAGNVIGPFHRSARRPPSIRRTAAVLAMLALAIKVFSAAPSIWLSVVAAFCVGMACLAAGAAARSLLIECAGGDVKRQTTIMAAWAVAWAGSKPIASFTDGGLAGLIGSPGDRDPACRTRPASCTHLDPAATDRQSGLRGPLVRVARRSERNRYSAHVTDLAQVPPTSHENLSTYVQERVSFPRRRVFYARSGTSFQINAGRGFAAGPRELPPVLPEPNKWP
jgi:hypothetical protein